MSNTKHHKLTPNHDILISNMLKHELTNMILNLHNYDPIENITITNQKQIEKRIKESYTSFDAKTIIRFINDKNKNYGEAGVPNNTLIWNLKNQVERIINIIKNKEIYDWMQYNFYDVFYNTMYESNPTYKDTRDDDIMLYKLEHYNN